MGLFVFYLFFQTNYQKYQLPIFLVLGNQQFSLLFLRDNYSCKTKKAIPSLVAIFVEVFSYKKTNFYMIYCLPNFSLL